MNDTTTTKPVSGVIAWVRSGHASQQATADRFFKLGLIAMEKRKADEGSGLLSWTRN
jgi:hypothetical protein